MEKSGKKIIAALVLVAVLIFIAAIIFYRQPAEPTPSPTTAKYEVPPGSNYSLGTSTPKITIIEFADFACPYCQSAHGTIRKIGIKYKNVVKIIFRDFPIHENSLDLAMSARCAGEQGLFWPMHDKLFSLQGQFATSSLPDLAVSIGANRTAFQVCMKNKKYLRDIQIDYAAGESINISGTPTFFINGYKVAGDIPEDKFEEIIKRFLK
jgi:protein-disulfide isomerase